MTIARCFGFDAACDPAHTPHERAELNKHPDDQRRDAQMLAEKFFLLLETLRSRSCADGSQRGISTARHVPMELPKRSTKAGRGD
jgi:hypothetical protein